MPDIAIERAFELFEYDPDTGWITRKISYGKAIAGQIFKEGHTISADGVFVRHGRLAWALHNGIWPPPGYWVDHIDRIKAHNWISNLRPATPTQNQQNKAGTGTYPKGVTWRDRGTKPWQAKIRVNGERIHLGSFALMEEAAEAYRLACIELHGEFACPE